MILSRLIAILTLGAAGVTTGGLLVESGQQLAGLLLDLVAIAGMRAAVEAHPAD